MVNKNLDEAGRTLLAWIDTGVDRFTWPRPYADSFTPKNNNLYEVTLT